MKENQTPSVAVASGRRLCSVFKALLLFVLVCGYPLSSYAQPEKVSLSHKNATVKAILADIEKQSKYRFVYNHQQIDGDRTLSITVSNEPISSVLSTIFPSGNVAYELSGSQIILSPKAASASSSTPKQKITGKVTLSDGTPGVGVSVVLKGTSSVVLTNENGEYAINAPQNATLQFRYIGQEDLDVEVGSRAVVDVILEPDIEMLEETVVVAYGTARKVGTVIGSVSKVGKDKIESRPSTNVMDALQGQVAGLQVMTSSGAPTAQSTMRLHGVGTFVNNDPLIILDGSPISSETLQSLNQADIENISMLKDASATSIYGTRASNGVLYITSKRGRKDGANITFRTQYSLSSPIPPKLKALSTNDLVDYQVAIGQIDVASNPNEPARRKALGNYDWFDGIFKRNVPMVQTDLSLGGGSDKSSYYVSGSYNNTDGIIEGSKLKRYTFRSNLDHRLNDWIKAGMNIGAGYLEGQAVKDWTLGLSLSNPALAPLCMPSYQSPWDSEGNLYQNLPEVNDAMNPLIVHSVYPRLYNRVQVNGNMFVELTPLKGLVVRSNLANDSYIRRSKNIASADYKKFSNGGSVSHANEFMYSWTLTNTAEYKFSPAEKHNFILLVGQESIFNSSDVIRVGMKGQRDGRFMFLQNGTELISKPSNTISKSAFNSILGRFDYNYAEKYYVDFSLRNDASSKFGKKNRSAMFYSVGAMWNMKSEGFLSDISSINSLSLKASYGTSGNSASVNEYDQYGRLDSGGYNGEQSWIIDWPGNSNLGWESQSLFTAGVSTMLYSKFRVNLDYYIRNTKDMLLYVPHSYTTTGFGGATLNSGTMRNSGLDVSIGLDVLKTRDWTLSVSTSMNYNKNKLTSLSDGQSEKWAGWYSSYFVGYPAPVFYLPEWKGVDSQTGKPQWSNGNGGITNDFWEAPKQNLNKSYIPNFTGGASIAAKWKDLSLVADVSWVGEKWMMNTNLMFSEGYQYATRGYNQTEGVLDYWKKPGDKSRFPSLEELKNMGGMQEDSHYLENGAFVRLKNVMLTYTLPSSILAKQNILSKARVWVGARNLLTWTKYKGLDPEIDTDDAYDVYPNTRQVTFGIELTF